MSLFKLGKPPIVESWLHFDFEPNPNKREWDGKLADKFATSLSNRFPKKKYSWRGGVLFEEPAKGQPPKPKSFEHRFHSVRIENEDRTQILQIEDDRIVFGQLKGEDDWPGFETLLDESLRLVDTYRSFFQPGGIKNATLHDVDIVEIPAPGGSPVELDEHIKIVKELPQQPFGLVQGYLTSYVTKSVHDDEPLQISLQLMPSPEGSTSLKFRFDWIKQCGKIKFTNPDTVRSGLLENHDYVVKCFRESFTESAFKRFEPQP